ARGRRRLSLSGAGARRAWGSGAGCVAAAARAGGAAPVRAVRVARLGRAMSHDGRTGRAVGAAGGAVVAEPVRARAGLADGAGHEARLLAARRACRAARDLALAVDVQVAVAHRVPDVMGDAAHVLAVVAGAGALAVDGRAHRVDAWIAAAGARRRRKQHDGSDQREREDEVLPMHTHLLVSAV